MKAEEEKDDMPKLKRRSKRQCEGFVESARCGQFVTSCQSVVRRQRGEIRRNSLKVLLVVQRDIGEAETAGYTSMSKEFCAGEGRALRGTCTLTTESSYHSYIKRK